MFDADLLAFSTGVEVASTVSIQALAVVLLVDGRVGFQVLSEVPNVSTSHRFRTYGVDDSPVGVAGELVESSLEDLRGLVERGEHVLG